MSYLTYLQQFIEAQNNTQINQGHSLLRTVCEWFRHSIATRATQTVPITTGDIRLIESSDA